MLRLSPYILPDDSFVVGIVTLLQKYQCIGVMGSVYKLMQCLDTLQASIDMKMAFIR